VRRSSILEEALEAKSAKRPELVEQNKKAFRRGLELGQALGD